MANLNLPRGPENAQRRIDMRAEAIYRGVWWGEQLDDGDINSKEMEEINKAKEKSSEWMKL